MSAVVGELVWKVTGDTSGIDKSLKQTDQKAQGLSARFKSEMMSMAKAITVAAIAKKIFDIGRASLKAAANMETQTIAFTTMLGSAEKAQSLIKQISDFAASTPFQLPEIIDASKKLIAFGESSTTVIDTIRRLGDVASGLSIPLGELTEIYGKARVQGTLYAEDLNQLAGRGIPIFEELSKVMGVPADQIKKLGSEGKITFSELEQVFKNLTTTGGQFAGLMEAQSKSLDGKVSNLGDNLGKTALIIGDALAPAANEAVSLLGHVVDGINAIGEAGADEPESLGLITRTLKNMNSDLDGTWDRLNAIYDRMGEEVDESITNTVRGWEATSGGVSENMNKIFEQHGEINSAAVIYGEYLSGSVKLTKEQIAQLEKILALGRGIGAEAKSELESWRQRGLVASEVIKEEEEKGKKLSYAQKKWLSERKQIYAEVSRFINENTLSETELLKIELEERKSALLKYSKDKTKTAETISQLEEIYSNKIKDVEKKNFEERLNNFNNFVNMVGGALTGLLSAFQSLNEAQGAQAIASLDARMEAELEAAGLAEETAVEKAESELKAAEETGNKEVIAEKRKALEKAKIEEKYAKKKAQLEYEIALQSWELQRAMALVQMLQAPLNAFTSTLAWAKFPGGMALAAANAAIAALTAGIQFAAVDASKPQAPKFEQGGIVPGSSYSGDNMLARVNSGEMILNQQQQAQLFNVANGGGGGYRQVPPMSEDSLWKMIFEASKSGDLFIAERAVTSR